MATPLLGTESGANAVKRIRYDHDALIDMILARPEMNQNELAAMIGFSVPWISRVMCSDAFQARLAERKTEIIDPAIKAEIEEKLRVSTRRSLDIVQERLDTLPAGQLRTDLALETLKITTKALGFGAREGGRAIVQNFVVALPEKAENQQKWVEDAKSRIMDVTAKEVTNV